MTDPEPRPRGRPAGHTRFGEPTVPMRVPVSAKAEVVHFLEGRRQHLQRGTPRPHTLFAAGEPLVVTRAAQDPVPFEVPTLLSRVPAGFPSPADDYLDDGCDLNRLLVANRHATYFIRVSGDSVNALGIFDGDLAVVDCSLANDAKHGNLVIAIIHGEGHTIKVLHKTDTEIALEPRSTNPIHKRRVITEYDEWLVWGVVTSVVRQLRR